jgi:hypothetical protein
VTIPLPAADTATRTAAVGDFLICSACGACFDCDRIHAGRRKSVRRDAKQVLRRSAERHIAFLRGDLPAY